MTIFPCDKISGLKPMIFSECIQNSFTQPSIREKLMKFSNLTTVDITDRTVQLKFPESTIQLYTVVIENIIKKLAQT